MANAMLLWWTLDSVPLPLVIKPKVVKEALQWSDERKCTVAPVKPNWQAIWTYNAITSLLLNDTYVRRTTDLEKTVDINFLLMPLSVTTSADAHKGKVWAHDQPPALRRSTRKKTDFTREQPMHTPKVPLKPKLIEQWFPTFLWTCTPYWIFYRLLIFVTTKVDTIFMSQS